MRFEDPSDRTVPVSAGAYAQWLAQGNAELTAGRAIDALICYRQALRELGEGSEAHFQLGKIAWRLGHPDDAIALWRQVAQSTSADGASPVNRYARRALADALPILGRFEEAASVVAEALARRPKSVHLRSLAALLRVARGGSPSTGDDASDSELRTALATTEPWPLALAAVVASQIAAAGVEPDLVELALASAYRAVTGGQMIGGGEDALRVVALVLATDASERATAVGARYASVCAELAAGTAPAFWPQRAGGAALRAGLLRTGAARNPEMPDDALTIEQLDRGTFAVTVLDLAALPPDPDAAARTLATYDFDVLIDLDGLAHAAGPVLALRPARRLWGVTGDGSIATPALVDRVLTGGVESVTAALAELASEVVRNETATERATPAELAARRDAAVIAHRDGDHAAARTGYDWVLSQQPGDPQTHYLRALLERDRGNHEDALTDLRAAVDAAPDYVDARSALAQLLTAQAAADDAVAIARDGLARATLAASKRSAPLWRALGQAELARGNPGAAAGAFAEALVRAPEHAETHYNHGVALQKQRDFDAAAQAWQRALAFDPGLEAAHFNLGVVFDQQGRADAAVSAFTQALALAPGHAAAYKALGETLHAAGRIDDWVANFRRFEANCADHIGVAPMAIEVSAWLGDYSTLDRILEGLRKQRFGAVDAGEFLDALQQLLFLLLYVDIEPELLAGYSRLHNDLARRHYGEPWPRTTPRRAGRPRIGYVSGDLRDHVMGRMMWEALRHHDHARFEVFGYTTDRRRDAWTARIGDTFDHFDDVSALGDVAAAHRIAGDDIDLLVDLSTHTKGARPGIFALKPARVQVTHVASAGTAALAAIDFKLTDHYADVEGNFPEGLEAPLVMDGCVYPWRHLTTAPDASGVPRPQAGAAEGLVRDARDARAARRERVVIGAFVTPLKLSQRCLALWREVLQRIPRAVLAFSPLDARTRDAYVRLAASAGIDAGRVVLVPRSGDEARDLGRYRGIDFVLDPMPYGGVNGTLEPLAMGVPVVTLVGRRHGERSSYSILENLGVTETIAHTGPDYVEIAQRLADDPAFMRDVRDHIHAAVAHSTLTDMESHTRNLERALLAAIEQRAPEAVVDAGVGESMP